MKIPTDRQAIASWRADKSPICFSCLSDLTFESQSPATGGKFFQCFNGVDAAAKTEFHELGNVQPPASGLGSGHPPLGFVDLVGELPLRKSRCHPHGAAEWWNSPVNQRCVRLRHRRRLSAAVALNRFSHNSLDARIASVDNLRLHRIREFAQPSFREILGRSGNLWINRFRRETTPVFRCRSRC